MKIPAARPARPTSVLFLSSIRGCKPARRNRTLSPDWHVPKDLTCMLDRAECDRARLARDPAYDGRFYSGVRATRVYCRPVCPVRPAQSRNVLSYPSAAAAEAAGFRPCLRCRPETAPFSPAWNGSRTTVARGLRLIVKGALDGRGATVGALAARLGVGERHLVRLFTTHSAPVRVRSRRWHACSARSGCLTPRRSRRRRSRCHPPSAACVGSMQYSLKSAADRPWPCANSDARLRQRPSVGMTYSAPRRAPVGQRWVTAL
jgi:methylphosphotriester-DNA--protein-cysteine methyltransferase